VRPPEGLGAGRLRGLSTGRSGIEPSGEMGFNSLSNSEPLPDVMAGAELVCKTGAESC
jgi:hypothetical protein